MGDAWQHVKCEIWGVSRASFVEACAPERSQFVKLQVAGCPNQGKPGNGFMQTGRLLMMFNKEYSNELITANLVEVCMNLLAMY